MCPLVAVVIPCYNYGQYIEEAVDSVLNSTFQDFEIVIVDDGSTDNFTQQVLNKMKLKPKTRVIHRENGGLSAARNTGFENTNARYVLTLDADDLIHPTFIEKGIWLLERKSDVSFVYSLVQLFGDYNFVWETFSCNLNYLKFRNVIPATIIIRRSVWDMASGYDETMREGYEDWEFILRIGKMGHVGYHINEILFYYRKHSDSMLAGSKTKHKKLHREIRTRNPEIFKYIHIQWVVFAFLELLRQIQKRSTVILKYVLSLMNRETTKKIYYKLFKHNISELMLPSESFIDVPGARDNLSIKKSIMIVLPWLEVGGVEKVFYHIVSSLYMKFDFIVVTTKSGSSNPREDLFRPYVKAILHLGNFGENEQERLLFLNYLINVYNIDIVHISNSQFAYRSSSYLKVRNPNIRIIDTLHMEEPWSAWDYFQYSIHFSNSLDLTTTLTLTQKMSLNKMNSTKKVEIIPNGIPVYLNNENRDSEHKGFTIGFIGRITEQKHPLFFLRILLRSYKQNLPFHYLIIGEGALKGKLMRLVAKLNLNSIVKFKDFSDDIYKTLGEIDVLCAPSLREGLPMIGLEAMSVGIPIVASNVPGWSDLIINRTTGFLCEFNEEEFIDKFILLSREKELYYNISENARETAKAYSLERMIEGYEKIYEKVMRNEI